MIIKILLAIFALLCLIVYYIAKSMKDGNNVGNFIEEEQAVRLQEFINDINNQKDGGMVG